MCFFSHPRAHLNLAQCEPKGWVSVSYHHIVTPIEPGISLKNITFEYKKLSYKLLHSKFNTLKKYHPGKPHQNFKFALSEAHSRLAVQWHSQPGRLRVLHPGRCISAFRSQSFLGWFSEVHKYIVLFLFVIPSQLIFLISDEIDQCWAKKKLC